MAGYIYAEFGSPVSDSGELESVSLGVSHAVAAGGAPQKAQVHDAHFTISIGDGWLFDVLWQACVSGNRFNQVVIYFYQSEDSLYPYLTYTMKNVYVAQCSVHGNQASIGLNFDSVTWAYNKK